MLRCGVSSVASACIFALCKLLLFHDHFCCVYFHTIFVRVASCLDTSGHNNLQSLTEILLSELSVSSKRNATDEVSSLIITITFESSVYC